MSRTAVMLALLLSVYVSASSSGPVSAAVSDDPSFYSVAVGVEYPKTFELITQADFRNFDVKIFDSAGHVQLKARLKDGVSESGSDVITLNGIWYFDLAAQRAHYALVSLSWQKRGDARNSEASYGVLQLFTIENRRLKLAQQIFFPANHLGAGPAFDYGSKLLLINSSHYTKIDPHCCPSQRDLVRFQWTGHDFQQAGVNTQSLPRQELRQK